MQHRTISTARGSSSFTTGRLTSRAVVAAAVLGGGFATASTVAAEEQQSAEELLARAQALIAQAEAQKTAEAEKTQETKAQAMDRVLADADRRSSRTPIFLQDADDPNPFTAGHNGKFLLQSEDGTFTLNPNFQLQIRYVANFNSTNPDDGETGFAEDFQGGFELRRTKIGFKGNAFSKDLTYDIKFAFNREPGDTDDDIILENGFIDYTPETGLFGNEALGFRIGQYKDPTFFEEAVSSSKQLTADRSLVNEVIGGGVTDFIQGAGFLYKADKVKALHQLQRRPEQRQHQLHGRCHRPRLRHRRPRRRGRRR